MNNQGVKEQKKMQWILLKNVTFVCVHFQFPICLCLILYVFLVFFFLSLAFVTIAWIFIVIQQYCRTYGNCNSQWTRCYPIDWSLIANTLDLFDCELYNTIFMHQFRIYADNRMYLANRYTCCNATQISIIVIFNCLF